MYEKQKYDEAYRHYKSVEAMAENSILHPTEDISSPASFLQVEILEFFRQKKFKFSPHPHVPPFYSFNLGWHKSYPGGPKQD